MSHVFISYSHKNQTYTRQLADELRRRGFEVWNDDKIGYGARWQLEIFKAIEDCAAFIVIMSPDSLNSDWVEKEYLYADSLKKNLFPLLIEGTRFPYFVNRQCATVQNGALPPEDYFARLAQVVEQKKTHDEGIALSPRAIPTVNSAVTKRAAPAARTKNARQYPAITKPDWAGKILPEPFEWCFVPTGKVTLEPNGDAGDYLTRSQSFSVPAFKIARYPVTNAQFERFLTSSNGWSEVLWWDFSAAAIQWWDLNQSEKESYESNCDVCPRTNVSWYAAVAFTRWLSVQTGEKISLPTEQQWQRAAQGDDERIYPWGYVWDSDKCNTAQSGIITTTPVTKYPMREPVRSSRHVG